MKMKKIADEKAGIFGGKLFNFRPCFFAAIFLCIGICFSKLIFVHGYPIWIALLPIGVAITIGCTYRTAKSFLAGTLLALCVVVGFCGYWKKAEDFTSAPFYNQTATVYGRVVETVRISENTLNLVLDDISIDGKEEAGKLFVKVLHNEGEDGRICVSDFVFVECELRTNTNLSGIDAVYPASFAEDVRFTATSNFSVYVSEQSFAPFADFRERLKERLYLGMGENVAAVCYGVLVGDTSGIEDALLENIRAGGIAHLFAVSGLHVGTVFGALLFFCAKSRFLKERKGISFALVCSILLLYGGVCGYTASVLRAIIICLCAYAFKLFGLKRDMVEGLSFAASVLLVFNPAQLFCVGFQLSFAACYGIAFLAKPIATGIEKGCRALFVKSGESSTMPPSYPQGSRGKFFSFVSVSFGAQVATAPILLNTFGYLSSLGWLLNFIFIPLVGGIFSFTLLLALIATCLPTYAAAYLLHLPNAVWAALLLLFQTTEFSVAFLGVKMSFSAMLFYYGFFLFCSDKFNLPKTLKNILRLGFLILFILAFIFGFLAV